MLDHALQATRQLTVTTPQLPENELLLRSLNGREQLSHLFEYELELLSPNPAIDPLQLVGYPISFAFRDAAHVRPFHGYISRFRYVSQSDLGTTYRATVVPWLWFLTQTADCRIFQHRSAVEIVEQIFNDLRASNPQLPDFEWSLRGKYPKREYCVQYRETDFQFVSRLLEEEGIFYFFRHGDGQHTLVLADQPTAYFTLPDKEVECGNLSERSGSDDQITAWQREVSFRPGRVTHADYNFETPGVRLRSSEQTVLAATRADQFELYDYPGIFAQRGRGEALARVRMEEQEVPYDIVRGEGCYRSFTPGGTFVVKNHRRTAEIGNRYVLTAVETSASVGGSYLTGTGGGEIRFANRFECIPGHVPFRPARTTRRPIVEGAQTAVVVGPGGEEIYVDEHGRVKVQFHWDREGQHNENSSCWVRVSQAHAGKAWGGMDIPRIGEEVIVDFLEGDPDRPLITGRVYNADNMPPFALPGEMTRSGIKSQTHKGQGFNEISMDDTAGKEQLRMHAQHNMDTAVGNNQTLVVNVDRTTSVGNNDTTKIGNNATTSVGNHQQVTVGNNMNVQVGNRLVFNAGNSITLKCGASKIHMNSGGLITITGTMITMAAAANASVAAPLTQVVGGVMLTTIGGVNMMNGAVCHVGAAGLASVAGGKVDVAAAGTTSIKGGTITLN